MLLKVHSHWEINRWFFGDFSEIFHFGDFLVIFRWFFEIGEIFAFSWLNFHRRRNTSTSIISIDTINQSRVIPEVSWLWVGSDNRTCDSHLQISFVTSLCWSTILSGNRRQWAHRFSKKVLWLFVWGLGLALDTLSGLENMPMHWCLSPILYRYSIESNICMSLSLCSCPLSCAAVHPGMS